MAAIRWTEQDLKKITDVKPRGHIGSEAKRRQKRPRAARAKPPKEHGDVNGWTCTKEDYERRNQERQQQEQDHAQQ